jgi:SHS2 domain-containing protein
MSETPSVVDPIPARDVGRAGAHAWSRAKEHVGEWRLALGADSYEALLGEAARVVARACGPTRGEPGPWEPVTLTARDGATLLADWMNELIGRSEVAGRAYREVRAYAVAGVDAGDAAGDIRLTAEVRGTPVSRWRSPLKAATYHGLVLRRRDHHLCVHRKGARRAFGPGHRELPAAYRAVGQPVFIPGSMGTVSYVLAALAGAETLSWASACHGAGRSLSRTAVKRQVTGAALRRELEAQGIVVRCPSNAGLAEEAPVAYKDVERVAEVVERAGLARRIARLRPLGVVKG